MVLYGTVPPFLDPEISIESLGHDLLTTSCLRFRRFPRRRWLVTPLGNHRLPGAPRLLDKRKGSGRCGFTKTGETVGSCYFYPSLLAIVLGIHHVIFQLLNQ